MTNIVTGKNIERETSTVYRGRPIIVELHPGYLALRLKGKRDRVTVAYEDVLEFGYRIRQEEAMRA